VCLPKASILGETSCQSVGQWSQSEIQDICLESCFLRERLDVDSEQFSRVFRVTEFLAEGCIKGLENLGLKETPMFVAKITGAGLFLKLQLRNAALRSCTSKQNSWWCWSLTSAQARRRSCNTLEPRTGVSFALNSQ